jgi:hypothetical protein
MANILSSQNVESKKKISDETKIYIVEQLIEPSFKDDIKKLITDKKCWKCTGITFETVSKIMVAISGVFSFSSGYFQNPMLSFISGSIATLSLALLQFSGFSYSQNKKTGQDLNILLKSLDLETIPVLARVSDDGSNAKMRVSSMQTNPIPNVILNNNDDISDGSIENEKQENINPKMASNQLYNNPTNDDNNSV